MDNPFMQLNQDLSSLSKGKVCVKCGTVTDVNPFKVKIDGDTEAFGNIKTPKGYSATVGDRVAFLLYDNKYIMIQGYGNSSTPSTSVGMTPSGWNGIDFNVVDAGIHFAINAKNGPSGFSHGLYIGFKFAGAGFTTSYNDSTGRTPVIYQIVFNFDSTNVYTRVKTGKAAFTSWAKLNN